MRHLREQATRQQAIADGVHGVVRPHHGLVRVVAATVRDAKTREAAAREEVPHAEDAHVAGVLAPGCLRVHGEPRPAYRARLVPARHDEHRHTRPGLQGMAPAQRGVSGDHTGCGRIAALAEGPGVRGEDAGGPRVPRSKHNEHKYPLDRWALTVLLRVAGVMITRQKNDSATSVRHVHFSSYLLQDTKAPRSN